MSAKNASEAEAAQSLRVSAGACASPWRSTGRLFPFSQISGRVRSSASASTRRSMAAAMRAPRR